MGYKIEKTFNHLGAEITATFAITTGQLGLAEKVIAEDSACRIASIIWKLDSDGVERLLFEILQNTFFPIRGIVNPTEIEKVKELAMVGIGFSAKGRQAREEAIAAAAIEVLEIDGISGEQYREMVKAIFTAPPETLKEKAAQSGKAEKRGEFYAFAESVFAIRALVPFGTPAKELAAAQGAL